MKKIVILFACFLKLYSCVCPLCPFLALLSFLGGFNTQSSILSVIGGLSSMPFMLAFFDGFRTRNMTFSPPMKDSVYRVNESLDLYMETFGLSSRSFFRTSDLFLLNASFDRVAKVASEKEFRVILQSNYSKYYILPKAGLGHMKWTAPDLPNGRYYLKYVSGWTIWRHEGKFSAISNPFFIVNSDCDKYCLDSIPSSPEPTSFTRDNAPLELQFMFPKYDGAKAASLDFMRGVASTPRLLMNPKKAINEWENEFEKNPFKATGQAVGVFGVVAVSFKTIGHWTKKSPCFGGACSYFQPKPVNHGDSSNLQTEIKISGTRCMSCTTSIANGLKNLDGIADFWISAPANETCVLKVSSAVNRTMIVEMIQNIGYDVTSVTVEED